MSNLKIEERFTIEAPVERVFRFLLDPAAVATCLPGARLDGKDESASQATYLGTMKVKVGPVVTEFKGRATMSEIDEAAHSLRLDGTGDDKTGGGSAKMTMRGRVEATASGGSEVFIDAEVELAGKLVRFGRGMIDGVSKQLFKQFVERLREKIASAPAAAAPPAPAPAPPAPSVENAAPPAPAAAEGAATQPEVPAPAAQAPAPAEAVPPVAAPAQAAAPEPAPVPAGIAAPSAAAPPAPSSASPKPAVVAVAKPTAASTKSPAKQADDDEALDAGALVFRVMWDWVKGLFKRLFGRR